MKGAATEATIPMRRAGEPREVAGVVTFVHSRRLSRTLKALFAGTRLPDGRVHALLVALLAMIALGGLLFVVAGTSLQ